MGYLMKEALKTLCGVNQWAYAVFWKIDCQNPKLLIWEECYYEFVPCSGLPGIENPEPAFHDYENLSSDVGAPDKVHSLVNRMMIDSYVNIIGEGLVGRVAFTRDYQWILSENCYRSPEVLKEVCQQFAAGMQTVVVIPVLPHGVIQFGSFLTIAENTVFVSDVISLLLQLGYASEEFAAKGNTTKLRVPENSASMGLSFKSNMNESPYFLNNLNYVGNTCESSCSVAGEIRNDLQSKGTAFPASTLILSNSMPQQCHNEVKVTRMNAVAKAEVIPSNSEMWMNQHVYIPRVALDVPGSSSSPLNHNTIGSTEAKIFSDVGDFKSFCSSAGIQMSPLRTNSSFRHYSGDGSATTRASAKSHEQCKGRTISTKPMLSVESYIDMKWTAHGNVSPNHLTSTELGNVNFTSTSAFCSDSLDSLMTTSTLSHSSGGKHLHMDSKLPQCRSNACKEGIERTTVQSNDIPGLQHNECLNMAPFSYGFIENNGKLDYGGHVSIKFADAHIPSESGDDLFDVLGADFKNKLFRGHRNGCLSNESTPRMHRYDNNNLWSKSLAGSEICSTSQANSESEVFCTGADNLLEAVVSKVHSSGKRSLDDNLSSRTTLMSTSSSPAPGTSLPYDRFGVSDHMKGELRGVSKYPVKARAMSSCSLITEPSKEELTSYSQGSSIYGPQLWIQEDPKAKANHSASTSHSKKTEQMGKTNRRRLKPGENPRPRPKDRQMIQDRVKELREIVPNGAKCSIDALLERTIKHMLFLQSVTTHADKLKEAGESKIISKNGGLLLKDNFEGGGGATWAYEVGSQSMVCPIIVEDLNEPRQMFVEMLCEEKGLFLEIADVIRGLGLAILKGVMEARNDKIWARFAVEANRDVTRMEIFISLVRLLEQSAKQPNGISNENVMDGQQFHQAAAPLPVPD